MTGFQKLICLGLERQPAADLIPGTVAAWCEAITRGRCWDETRDRPRLRQAFTTLAATRKTWPAPGDLLEALPPAPQLKALPAKPADPERAKRCIAEVRSMLRMG